MSAELSIALTRLRKEAVSVAGSGRTNAPAVSESLGRLFEPGLGQPNPDYMALQLSLVQMVENELVQTEKYDESLVDELDQDRSQLAERIAATDEVTDKLTAVQSACDGVYGAEASLNLFSQFETLPRDPVRLAKLARRVRRRLADPEYPLPKPRLKSWPMAERVNVATELGVSVDRLDRALDVLTGERKASDNRRFVKSEAVDRFRRTLRYSAGCLASLYGLAGFDELAAKILPKRRRRRRATGGSGDEAGDTAEPQPAQDGAEAAASEPLVGPTLVES